MMFYLKKLKMVNFRCYNEREFFFDPGINIIIGFNAAGKTTLVEGIHCLGFGRTFKNTKDLDLIKKGATFYNIKGEFYNDDEISDILLAYDSKDKRIIRNDKTYKSISEYLGFFNTVVFSPDDLELVKGTPAIRRRFLDVNMGQINKKYLFSLIKFKQILKERNQFLKSLDGKEYNKTLLTILTDGLIEASKNVIIERKNFIEALNLIICRYSLKLSNNKEKVEIVYKPNVNVDNLGKSAREHASYDLLMQSTTWGPNRDEVLILINGDLATTYSSQGQIRTACLAIKLGLAELFSKFNDKIIIILDDVFSELDKSRQKELLKLLKMTKQIFITTTSVEHLTDEVLKSSKIIEITRRRED